MKKKPHSNTQARAVESRPLKNPAVYGPAALHNKTTDNGRPQPYRQSDLAYDLIKDSILFCDLAPGAEVSESQMASRFKLGKAPIRSALARLVQENLVRVVPRSGYSISPLTIKDIRDVFELRMMLEAGAARMAAGRVDADSIRRLDEICRVGYDPDDRDSQKAYLQANQRIHMTIARAAGNQRLAIVIGHLLDEMCRMLYLGMCLSNKSDEWKHGHEDVLSALVRGDGAEAERITLEHLESGRRLVLDAAISSPDLTRVNLVPVDRSGAGRPS